MIKNFNGLRAGRDLALVSVVGLIKNLFGSREARLILKLSLYSCALSFALGCKGTHKLEESSNSSNSVLLKQSAFETTVYAYVKTQGCTGCHANGPTAAKDWFAAPDVATAYQAALGLINIKDPANSLFAGHVKDSHCGFAAICGVDNGPMLDALKKWIDLSSALTNSTIAAASCTLNGQILASGATINGFSAATVPFGGICADIAVTATCTNGNLNPSSIFPTCSVLPGATCAFNGQTLDTGVIVKAYQAATVAYGTSCVKEDRVCTNGTLSGSYAFPSCTVNPPLDCTFDTLLVKSGSTVAGYPTATVPFGQTCKADIITCTNGVLNPPNDVAMCSTAPGLPCNFNGTSVPSGSSVTAYQAGTVPFGQTCAAQAQTRTCTNGVLSGSYTFASCTVDQALACMFNGKSVASGSTVQGFPSATVPFGQTCTAQTSTCTNGVLNPANLVPACTVQPPANCTFNGQTVLSGASVTAFQAASVSAGQVCSSQVRTCTNGVLSGTFAFGNCVVDQPATCTFNGMTVVSGSTVQGYPSATVPFGQTCQAQTITCTNGVLNPANDVASCTVQPGASCQFNGQTIASGSSVTAYSSSTVPFGSLCSGVAQTRTCTNGTLSGTFTFASCTVNAPASCSFNGQTIASGITTIGFPTATVPFGQTCKADTITCTNGVLNPANDVPACSVLPGASCTFGGQTIASGGTVTAYSSATVPFGTQCSSVAQTRTCTNGVLSGTFANASCSVSAPADCTFSGMTVKSGATTQGYPKAQVPFGQMCVPDTITCTNGVLSPANDVAACTVAPGVGCSFNGTILASGATATGYASATVAPGQACAPTTVTCTNGVLAPSTASPTCVVSSSIYGSTFVPANQSLLIRLNIGLNPAGKKTFQCQNATNCNSFWQNSGQFNSSFKTDPNSSTGANQVSLLAFAGCNDVDPSTFGVTTGSTIALQTANLINAGVMMVDNHTGGLGSNATYNAQVKAAFQALISDPAYSGATVKQVFVGICTAANTFGIGMKGF